MRLLKHTNSLLTALTLTCIVSITGAGGLTIECDEGDSPVFAPPLHDGEEVVVVAAETITPDWDSTQIINTPMQLFDTAGGTRELVAVEFHYFICMVFDITLHPNTEPHPVGSQGNWDWIVNLSLPDANGLILPYGNNIMPHGQLDGGGGFGFGRNVGFPGDTFDNVSSSSMRPDLTTAPEYLQALSGTGTTTLRAEVAVSDIVYSDLDADPWVFDPDFLEIALDHVQVGVKAHFYYNDVEQPQCPADLANNDGVIDVFDLFVLLSNWSTGAAGADLAKPLDTVDVFDLFVLLSEWGACD